MPRKTAKTIPFQAKGRYYARTTAKRCQYWDGETDAQGAAVLPAEDVPALVTRWGYQASRHSRPKDAYVLHTGEWVYIDSRVATEIVDGQPVYGGNHKGHAFRRIEDRWVFDRHVAQTAAEGREPVKIHIVDGRVAEIVGTRGAWEGLDLLGDFGAEFAHERLGIPYPPAEPSASASQADCRAA